MRRILRFMLGDETIEIASADPTGTLLDWLRLERGLTGTKEGCAEGDCGACTVAVGRLRNGEVRYEAVNACIRFLPTLDGCRVLTVEHLARGGGLHPVQRALVEHHGSQCGFCTPGFAMSLFCLSLDEAAPSPARIDDALAGNLCRCTGYGPIADAALQACAGIPASRDPGATGSLADCADGEILALEGAGRRFFAPATLDQLAGLLAAHPEAVLLAGGTDVGLWVTKEMRRLDPVIFLGRLADLRAIEDRGDRLVIGAAVSHAEAAPVLAWLHPHLGELMRRFGGAQIRNAGTVGGNIANGSPVGDLPPALIALDATLVLRGPDGRRRLPIGDYFLGYRRQDRRPGEFVEAVEVPRLGPEHILHVSKVSKRFDEDISAVCGAFRLARNPGGIVTEARLAFGGMAAVPQRAAAAEAALTGRAFDLVAAGEAADALAEDFTPLDDWRAGARYRLTVAGNLLRRFAIETATPEAETRVAGSVGRLSPLAGRGRVASATG